MPKRIANRTWRSVRLAFEPLEDRRTPHAGIALHTAGITADAGLAGLTAGPDDNVWFAEFAGSRIGRIGGVGNTGASTEFSLPAGRGPLNLTVGPDDRLYFTANAGDRIGRLDPMAGSDADIQASVQEFVVPGAGSTPHDLVTGPDGAIWFTQSGSDQIGRLDPATGTVTEFAVPGAGSMPSGIAVGSDGALWFTQSGSGQIGRVTTAGVVTEFDIPVPATTAFSNPEDITAGPGGHLYFTDFGRDQIGRITTAGAITQFNLPVGRGPLQIAATPDDHLYFTEAGSSRIGRLPAYALEPGRPTSGLPPLKEFDFVARDSVPLGIAAVGPDDIFFTLNNGNAIGAFASHLTQISIVAAGPTLEVFDINLNPALSYAPFEGYQGDLRLAVRDILPTDGATGVNGIPDAIVGVASGPPHVKVFDGGLGTEMASFFAFDPAFLGGVTVGADDVNGDGFADIVAAAGTHVKVIDGTRLGDVGANGVINDRALLASFFAFAPGAAASVSLAVGDLDGDGRAEITVGAGPGGGAHVKVISGQRFTQLGAGGVIADAALVSSFFAFDPGFTGGVFVAVPYNTTDRPLVIGAGAGGGSHVKVVDTATFGPLGPDGQIAGSGLRASFFAFGPGFTGGVRVASDDVLNSDGRAEVLVAAGPGGGPHVRVIDGARLGDTLADGTIAAGAELDGFFAGEDPSFRGGVFVAADADHRDGTIFGPPGINQPGGGTNSRRDINDIYIFQSPVTPANSVLAITVSPFSTTATPAAFVPGVLYDFRIANRDLVNVSDDLVFRTTFGPPDAGNNNVQDVTVRALPAAKFAGVGGVLVKGFTEQDVAVRGGAGTFRAAEHDDPFLFDAVGFNRFLNGQGLSDGSTAASTTGGPAPVAAAPFRPYPSGTSNGGAGDSDGDGLGFDGDAADGSGEAPDFNAPNFFANANTLAIILELPSAVLAGLPAGATLAPDENAVAFWGRTEENGVQVDRMGRPAINTAAIPPIPRGPAVPNPAADRRTAFNANHPGRDRADFLADVAGTIQAVYPIGAGDPATSAAVAGLLLPDVLVFDPTSTAGFFGDTIGTFGQADFFLAGGRKLSDDIISTEVAILTDPDSPFNLDGGDDAAPLIATQNVADDNGMNMFDGSVVGPGSALTGTRRTAAFPYFGVRNAAPADLPGGNPPP